MLTLTPDERAMLAGICEHPDEDTPRLEFADMLEDAASRGAISLEHDQSRGNYAVRSREAAM